MFERAYCVTLARRTDRWQQFQRHWADYPELPFIQRFNAIDHLACRPPAWWRSQAGAWGCYRSHLAILERCMTDNVESVLLFEDDAVPLANFKQDLKPFMDEVAEYWGIVYLGGEHLQATTHPPVKVSDRVYQAWNINRTHAWAVHRRAMPALYAWLNDFGHWIHGHHIDHHMGRLHMSGRIPVHCPARWMVTQDGGRSDIAHRDFEVRDWLNAEEYVSLRRPTVQVIGLHRSGSSCLAGMLQLLGVHMCPPFIEGAEAHNGGSFESARLAHLCEGLMPFPTYPSPAPQLIGPAVLDIINSAPMGHQMYGLKYPHLCAFAKHLPATRVVHIDRPIEDSVNSLIRREPHRDPAQLKALQEYLWDEKLAYLARTEHLRVPYYELLDDPKRWARSLAAYLGLRDADMAKAAAHIRPRNMLSTGLV